MPIPAPFNPCQSSALNKLPMPHNPNNPNNLISLELNPNDLDKLT